MYRGQWVDNEYHGQGELTWATGDKYTGITLQYILQYIHYIYRYTGAWSMGMMHGQGQYTYSDGSRYPGMVRGLYNDGVFVDMRGAGSMDRAQERAS